MATMKDSKKGICDEVYTELAEMKERMEALRDKFQVEDPATDKLSGLYTRHLGELAEQIEWRLQILSHACPFDWKGSAEYGENSPSVEAPENFDTDFSGGYIGG